MRGRRYRVPKGVEFCLPKRDIKDVCKGERGSECVTGTGVRTLFDHWTV